MSAFDPNAFDADGFSAPESRSGYAAGGYWAQGYAPTSEGDGSQTLTPALFTNTQTFYAPTVTRGAVTLQPARFDNAQTFYSPTVSQAGAPQTLTPSLFTNNQTFYGATITQISPQTLQPSLFVNQNVFFAPVVNNGFQDTHDGFWAREYRKMWERKPKVKEVVELVKEEPIAALEVVREVVEQKFDLGGNVAETTKLILKSVQLQRFIAQQLIIAAERKARDDEEADIEDILMLL